MIPLCDVGIPVGETLVVSAENKPLIAIATGTLTTVTDTTVTMVIDRWAVMLNEFSVYYLLYKLYKKVHKCKGKERQLTAGLHQVNLIQIPECGSGFRIQMTSKS